MPPRRRRRGRMWIWSSVWQGCGGRICAVVTGWIVARSRQCLFLCVLIVFCKRVHVPSPLFCNEPFFHMTVRAPAGHYGLKLSTPMQAPLAIARGNSYIQLPQTLHVHGIDVRIAVRLCRCEESSMLTLNLGCGPTTVVHPTWVHTIPSQSPFKHAHTPSHHRSPCSTHCPQSRPSTHPSVRQSTLPPSSSLPNPLTAVSTPPAGRHTSPPCTPFTS